MPENEVDISFVIVTWNSSSEIETCLNSIETSAIEISCEVILIDNASTDDTVKKAERFADESDLKVTILRNDTNTGFTKANNEGFKHAGGKFIFLLNPDTEIKDRAVKTLINFLHENNNTGAAAPQLLNADGSIQLSCRTFPAYWDMFCELSLLSYIFPNSRTFSKWKMKYFSHNEKKKVDQPMAAALVVKSEVLKEINFFDERFEMFFNDVDLCKKIYESGKDIYFLPEAKVCHLKGASVYKDRKRMIGIWNEDCLKYFKKHHYNLFLYSWLKFSLYFTGFFRRLFATTKS